MCRNYKFKNPEGCFFLCFAVVEWLNVEPWEWKPHERIRAAAAARSAKLSFDKSKLLGFEYDVYWGIDLNSFSLNSFPLQEYFQKHGVTSCWSNAGLKDNLVFFFSDQEYKEKNKLFLNFISSLLKKIIAG